MARRTQMEVTPAQRDFLRSLAYQSDRPMKAVLDDALLLLEALNADIAAELISVDGGEAQAFPQLAHTAENVATHYPAKETNTNAR